MHKCFFFKFLFSKLYAFSISNRYSYVVICQCIYKICNIYRWGQYNIYIMVSVCVSILYIKYTV